MEVLSIVRHVLCAKQQSGDALYLVLEQIDNFLLLSSLIVGRAAKTPHSRLPDSFTLSCCWLSKSPLVVTPFTELALS